MPPLKVLAVNINGDLTYCSATEENRGKGRCNHIAHQRPGESRADFLVRVADLNEKPRQEELFIPDDGAKVVAKPLRFSTEELSKMTSITNRFQLDLQIDGDAYIELSHPLWNDMDKNYFSQQNDIPVKSIDGVLQRQVYIIDSNSGQLKLKEGSFVSTAKICSILGISEDEWDHDTATKQMQDLGVHIETGVTGMNNFAAKHDFEATRHVYVLPYYMRQGVPNENGELIDSDLTVGYKYLLRTRSDPDKQQNAYSALLNNNSLSKDNARYTSGYRNSSLADEFAGKGGVFRAVLSGNSIPYSARAVITPSTKIKFGEIAIPPSAAIDLFKPTIISQLAHEGYDDDQIDAYFSKFRVEQTMVSEEDRMDLERRIANKRVLMNRQPSLHVSSLQSFRPRISPNASCQIRAEYCRAYGADFDGDATSLYGINQESIIPVVDRQLDASNPINTRIPRSQDDSAIMPTKDGLWGLLSILSRRGN